VEKKERLKRRNKRGEKGRGQKAGAVPHCTLPRIGASVEKKERLKRRKKRGEKGAAKKEKKAWRKRSG
jgi:hypothetical protein